MTKMALRRFRGLVRRWIAAAFLLLAAPAAGEADPVEAAFRAAMADVVASLDTSQRDDGIYTFDDEERFDLRLAPLWLEGLELNDMRAEQWTDLRRALGAVMSERGLAKADTIRSLEEEVAEMEGGWFGFLMGGIRDPGRYFLAVFGDPAAAAPFGLRFDGHHLSMNLTAVPGEAVSATPLFLGGQPREVPAGFDRAGLRVLADEEDHAVALIASLAPAERGRAKLPFQDGSQLDRPLFVGDAPQLELAAAAGIPVRALGAPARERFDRLVETHLANFAAPVAERYRARLAAEEDSLHFGYASPNAAPDHAPAAGEPFYYRIQSAGFLIEFDDTPPDADHIHVVVRSVEGDFARDLLAEHYAAGH